MFPINLDCPQAKPGREFAEARQVLLADSIAAMDAVSRQRREDMDYAEAKTEKWLAKIERINRER